MEKMPPKPRSLSVSKQCEECAAANPVACKTCTACGADFYVDRDKSVESPGDPSIDGDGTPTTPGSERRRSERVRREKPDYYDALEFETKRIRQQASVDKDKTFGSSGSSSAGSAGGAANLSGGTPTRPKRSAAEKAEKIGRSPRTPRSSLGEHGEEREERRGRPRKHGSGRATLTWKKGQDDDDDDRDKRKRKRKQRENINSASLGGGSGSSGGAAGGGGAGQPDPEEEGNIMDELPPEKSLQCQVSLAEINRKLGIVMCQPV